MTRPTEGSVIVITGATSGIGANAALAFARRRASLVLAARSEADLEGIRRQCEAQGSKVLAVSVDVRDEVEVMRLASRAVKAFGRIDTWVNNAGVIAYGTFEQLPSEVFRGIIETNLMGQVHGARAALACFRRQETGGVLINMSSIWGRVTTPLVTPYAVSKAASRTFSECLRHELVDEDRIEIVTIVPQAVDTPIFASAGNYVGRRIRPIPPIFDPQTVAEGIVACSESPKREVTYGRAGRALEILYAVFPSLYCRVAPAMFMRGSFAGDEAPHRAGNVLETTGGTAIEGGWRDSHKRDLAGAFLRAVQGALMGLLGRGSQTKPR